MEDLVQDHGPPAIPLALEYLQQTASALDKAHRHRDREGNPATIVHRDLKPDNLFVTQREDGTPVLKVLDFGIAKVLSASMQMSGDVKGTPTYMAYEQVARGVISPATDIWAFGLIAFFLFTGKNYWRAANSPDGTMPELFGSFPFLVVFVLSRGAHADDPAAAEVLFREGRELKAAGNIDAACLKLQASLALDPSPGTLLNLADCHYAQGRTATASNPSSFPRSRRRRPTPGVASRFRSPPVTSAETSRVFYRKGGSRFPRAVRCLARH